MARGGASCTHVDAAKGIVDWARSNAKLNNIDNVRWIVDDVQKFLQREIRRG
ncbi:MAG: SAM-dependent methyltransferase, partial [Flavobacteriaceae bacterium]